MSNWPDDFLSLEGLEIMSKEGRSETKKLARKGRCLSLGYDFVWLRELPNLKIHAPAESAAATPNFEPRFVTGDTMPSRKVITGENGLVGRGCHCSFKEISRFPRQNGEFSGVACWSRGRNEDGVR